MSFSSDLSILSSRDWRDPRCWRESAPVTGMALVRLPGKASLWEKDIWDRLFKNRSEKSWRSLCLHVTKHTNPFFSLQTCLDWPKLLHWVMNVELVMPRDRPFQPSPIFPLMSHFIFKKEKYSRAINLLSFFTHLQSLSCPYVGLPLGSYSYWVGRGQTDAQFLAGGPTWKLRAPNIAPRCFKVSLWNITVGCLCLHL